MKRARLDRFFMLIVGSSFLLNLALGIYNSIFQNFTGQELGLNGLLYGRLEGIREIPGLFTILLVALVVRISEERLYAITIGLAAIGIWLVATAHTFPQLVLATVIYSTGFHVWGVMQSSLVLGSVGKEERASRLGQLNGFGAAATLLSMGAVAITGHWFGSTLRPYFVIAGVAGIAGAFVGFLLKPSSQQQRRTRFVIRWRYRSYYVLTMLQGARRQIMTTFAGFLLVKLHHTPVTIMAALFSLQAFLAIWTQPLIGKIIDKVGEELALKVNYAWVTLIFLGYAFIQQTWILYILFLVDQVITGIAVAVNSHAAKIIDPADLNSSLATGTTINHIFGVSVPIVGGILWEYDPKVPFFFGIVITLTGLLYSWNLKARETKALAERAA